MSRAGIENMDLVRERLPDALIKAWLKGRKIDVENDPRLEYFAKACDVTLFALIRRISQVTGGF